jgi:protein O-GlcNAc transferase
MDRIKIFKEATDFQNTGELKLAQNAYEKILTRYEDPSAWNNLGTIHFNLLNFDKAEKCFWRAINIQKNNQTFINNYLNTLIESKQIKYYKNYLIHNKLVNSNNDSKINSIESEKILLTNISPDIDPVIEAVRNEIKNGNLSKALEILNNASNENAEERLNTKATLLLLMKKPKEAFDIFNYVLKINPNNSEANFNIGSALLIANDYINSKKYFYLCLNLGFKNIQLYRNLALLERFEGKITESINYLNEGLKLTKDDDQTYGDLATCYADLGDQFEAHRYYQKSIILNQKNANSLCNYGSFLLENNNSRLAEEYLYKSIEIKKIPQAFNNLGLLYMSNCQIEKSINFIDIALKINPNYKEAKSNRLFALNYQTNIKSEQLFLEYKKINDYISISNQINLNENLNIKKPYKRNKLLKIGFVSGDFYSHPVWNFLYPLLENAMDHDISVTLIYNGIRSDEITKLYQSKADNFVLIYGINDLNSANIINELNLDFVIDLSGHTKDNRLNIFKYLKNTSTGTWLGYNYTSGTNNINYFLTDSIQVPIEKTKYYTEKVIYISDHSLIFYPSKKLSTVKSSPFINNGYITFGCPSRSIRVNEEVIETWSEILIKLPNSKLVLNSKNFGDEYTAEIYKSLFLKKKIQTERIIFTYYSIDQFYDEIDICLDCFPHNSGTTLYESIYKGVPFITLMGELSIGRLGASLLSIINKSEYIAKDKREYIEKCLYLASSATTLTHLRSTLREVIQASDVMNYKKFTNNFYNSLKNLF